jgi:hypothetical protein
MLRPVHSSINIIGLLKVETIGKRKIKINAGGGEEKNAAKSHPCVQKAVGGTSDMDLCVASLCPPLTFLQLHSTCRTRRPRHVVTS